MSGICGYLVLDLQGRADPRIVETMCQVLAHRGPNDEGVWSNGPVALGQRNLSIIDISGGQHQPLSNEDGSIWITCDGAIYNFQELAEELVLKGHRFSSKSDTEILVHLYEEEGPDFLRRLNGMFALAVWDGPNKRLVLARDRMGQKSLYWGIFGGMLMFASELKAVLVHPAARRRLDLDSLSRYLALEAVPAPHSILKNIHKLLPSGRAVVEKGNVHVDTYWEYPLGANYLNISLPQAEECLLDLLRNAVNSRLLSGIPVGVFLSGGLDSSTVAALMSERGAGEVKSFSIGFEDPSFDESKYARIVARHLGTDHYEDIITPQVALDVIPKLSNLLDEPFADSSVIPTFLLSSFTKRHVSVALGGDGGDELLAGYPMYLAHKFAGFYEKLPGFMCHSIIEPIVDRLTVSMGKLKSVSRAKKMLLGLPYEGEVRHYVWKGSFTPEQQKKLLTPDAWDGVSPHSAYDEVRHYATTCQSLDPIERMLFIDAKLNMQDNALVKVDRASMSVGLEVRAPFLDLNVVEFLAGLPLSYKLKGLTKKYVLKRAVRKILPTKIINRKKKGFEIPVAKWLRGEFRALAEDMFATQRLRHAGLFRPESIRSLLNDHYAYRRDNHKYIWTLLMFELWYEHYL